MITTEHSSASQSAPYDPPGEVLTTDHLDAYMEDGRPMLNNYTRHSKIGGGQHGEVYLCYKINTRYARGHPDRRMAVVSQRLVHVASLPLNYLCSFRL
jgi:SNF1-activating kinase 1